MALATKEKAQEADASKEQLALLRNLHAGTPARMIGTGELAARVVRLWDILEIARGPKPAIDDSARSVWDRALSLYGGPRKDMKTAINALEKIHVRLIEELHTACSRAEDLGANIGPIHDMAGAILKDITRDKYANYKPHFRELIELSFVELGKVVPWKV